MQAITVRYIGPTNHRSARLVAECERGRITLGYPYGSGDPFVVALMALLQKFAEAHRPGSERYDGDNSDLFPVELGEWAYLNSDEISMAQIEVEENPECLKEER